MTESVLTERVTIDMPVGFLLTLATYGNMGDGEIPGVMRLWAQRMCREAGLDDKLRDLQRVRVIELQRRLRNVLGDAPMDKLLQDIQKAARVINQAMKE